MWARLQHIIASGVMSRGIIHPRSPDSAQRNSAPFIRWICSIQAGHDTTKATQSTALWNPDQWSTSSARQKGAIMETLHAAYQQWH
jgi:hypothetical protein